MANTCKYEKYQKYVSYDSGTTWSPLQEFKKGELIEADSPYCGYVPTPQYRWVDSGYTCINYDKWQQQIRQVSYDSGSTWENVVPNEYSATTLVEANSSYCGYMPPTPEYRWTASGYTCIGYDKWQRSIKQVSYDSGSTWSNVDPPQYSATTLVEANSSYCGYAPSTYKFQAIDNVGRIYSAECNSSSELTTSETHPNSFNYEQAISAVIGDCVTSIGQGALANYYKLPNIEIPNRVTSIGNWCFQVCSGLTSITLSSSITNIGEGTFYMCSGLPSITIPNSVTSIGNSAFMYCSGLTNITIPSTVTSIGAAAFNECRSLTSISIPNGVTTIGNSTFHMCLSLTSITIPNSVTSIGDSSLQQCTSLSSVTLPNSITSIGAQAFCDSSSITTITIPSSVTSIGSSAFKNCSGLTSVTVEATTPPTLGGNAFDGNAANRYIYVPSSSVNAYKSASGWSAYASRIQGI